MTYVPTVVVPHTPSHQTRELADKLAQVINEYEQTHPTLSRGEVSEAARLAVQVTRKGRGLEPATAAIAVGIGALLLGVFVFFMAAGGTGVSLAGNYIVVGLIAFFGVMAALLALLRRGSL